MYTLKYFVATFCVVFCVGVRPDDDLLLFGDVRVRAFFQYGSINDVLLR